MDVLVQYDCISNASVQFLCICLDRTTLLFTIYGWNFYPLRYVCCGVSSHWNEDSLPESNICITQRNNTMFVLSPGRYDNFTQVTVGLKSDGTTGRWDRRRDTWRSICHGPVSRRCLRATDAQRDTGPWRCSRDGTDDETRFIARRYVVRHHVFNLKLRFVHQ